MTDIFDTFETPDEFTEEIISDPQKCNRSDGNWSVQLVKKYTSGATVTYSKAFWRKKEAWDFIKYFPKSTYMHKP